MGEINKCTGNVKRTLNEHSNRRKEKPAKVFVEEAKHMLDWFGVNKIFWTCYKRAEFIPIDEIYPVWTVHPYGMSSVEVQSCVSFDGMRVFTGRDERLNCHILKECMAESLNVQIVDDWTISVSRCQIEHEHLDKHCNNNEPVEITFMKELKNVKNELKSYDVYWSFYNSKHGAYRTNYAVWMKCPYTSGKKASLIDCTKFRDVIRYVNGKYVVNEKIVSECAKLGLLIEMCDFWTVRIAPDWKRAPKLVSNAKVKPPATEIMCRKNIVSRMPIEIKFLWEAYNVMRALKCNKVYLDYSVRTSNPDGAFYKLRWTAADQKSYQCYSSNMEIGDFNRIVKARGCNFIVSFQIRKICKEIGLNVEPLGHTFIEVTKSEN